MTINQIRKEAPDGATHWDGLDYWKEKENQWFIWIGTSKKWRQIFGFKKFHDAFPVTNIHH